MPRQPQARDEGDDRFKEEPRYERLLQRTDVERAWLFERDPTLQVRITTYQAAKAAARRTENARLRADGEPPDARTERHASGRQ